MFTGIILAIGKITEIQQRSGDCRLTINTGNLSLEGVALGDSIAVNGICLTVVELGMQFFCADVSNESLSKTTLKNATAGMAVNLELALTLATRLGGHLVSGHVDGLATVIEKKFDARSIRFKFQISKSLTKYIAEKGSICLNGVSLTVNEVNDVYFSVNIVPHTLKKTTLESINVGACVNLEVDLLARYMERLMKGQAEAQPCQQVTMGLLQQSGFSV
ncbi:MAG: riboflavin synthase [Methylococcales bacterium]|nr:riboflavin synthase [Methylococcales bacterium]